MNTNVKGSLFVVIASVLVAMLAFHFMGQIQNPLRKEQDKQLASAPVPVPPTREQQFQDILNGMLHTVDNDMKEYRKQRAVLSQTFGMQNLTEPSYVEENYTLMQQLMSDMDKRMALVMQHFSDTEKQINGMLLDSPELSRKVILARWHALKDTQVKTYTDYFISDKELFEAYRQLMQFYYDKREMFFVDLDKEEIIFKNPEDAAKEKQLKDRIIELRNAQNRIFMKPDALPATPTPAVPAQ